MPVSRSAWRSSSPSARPWSALRVVEPVGAAVVGAGAGEPIALAVLELVEPVALAVVESVALAVLGLVPVSPVGAVVVGLVSNWLAG